MPSVSGGAAGDWRIRHLARKRFVLGYPPRKDQDTSIGDAINWEWTIECAKKSQRSVIIVSRDSDYGLTFEDESYLNEWLRHEFSERVGGKHQVSLTQSLSTALKQIKVRVTKAEEESEEKLIKATEPRRIDYLKSITTADLEKALQYSNDFNEMLRRLSEPEKKMKELNDGSQIRLGICDTFSTKCLKNSLQQPRLLWAISYRQEPANTRTRKKNRAFT
jgi:PIN domain